MGNRGDLGPGSAQLMKAASGIIHSEMPKQEAGLMRGFQLWINLPAANKMDDPEYQEYPAKAFPIVETQEHQVKVVIGEFADVVSPIVDEITKVSYFDVEVKGGRSFQYQSPQKHNSFLYIFEGSGRLNSKNAPVHTLIALSDEDKAIDFKADEKGARFVFISGLPINESVVQYGPFVMNSREEINQAMSDFQSNNFVRKRAWVKGKSE